MSSRNKRLAVSAAAVLLAVAGATLLFAPETGGRLSAPGLPIAQLFGAALLGFAAMNWVARGSTLGGIYGRAVVAGNYTHFAIGALVLLGRASAARGPAFWAATACYVAGAILFTWLQFFSTGLPDRS